MLGGWDLLRNSTERQILGKYPCVFTCVFLDERRHTHRDRERERFYQNDNARRETHARLRNPNISVGNPATGWEIPQQCGRCHVSMGDATSVVPIETAGSSVGWSHETGREPRRKGDPAAVLGRSHTSLVDSTSFSLFTPISLLSFPAPPHRSCPDLCFTCLQYPVLSCTTHSYPLLSCHGVVVSMSRRVSD